MSGVSYDVLSQFAKLVNKDKKTNVETTVYGTIVEDSNGNKYVKIDGTDQLTPYTTMPAVDSTDDENSAKNTAVAVDVNDRVSVSIKNHTATVTGNMSSPAAKNSEVQEIKQFDILMADRVQAVEAVVGDIEAVHIIVEDLDAAKAKITELEAADATITGKITAAEAEIENLEATKIDASIVDAQYANITGQLSAVNADISDLEAQKASIEDLKVTNANVANLEAANATITEKLTAAEADIKDLEAQNAEIDNLKAKDAEIEKLVADKADVKDLDAVNATIENLDNEYANIDFANIGEAAIRKIFSDTGMIKDLVVGDHTVTGELVGVTIIGDLIKAGTVKADKLVVKGSDGIYYKLNFEAGTFTDGEAVPDDSLHGSVITAKSITAEKVSVKDLVAFGATIGGFNISQNSLYSGVKSSVDNTTQGIYLDSEGQMAIGDNRNFIKYFRDSNGAYKLDISAESIRFGTSNETVDEVVNNAIDIANAAKDTADKAVLEATVNLRIDSSRGTVFKNNAVSTVLSAVIYKGSKRITDIDALHAEFGESAYLEWLWQRMGENTFGTILSTDSRIGNGGFTFTLSPEDVDTKVVFMCQLITD